MDTELKIFFINKKESRATGRPPLQVFFNTIFLTMGMNPLFPRISKEGLVRKRHPRTFLIEALFSIDRTSGDKKTGG
jgi:hypothetical protein